MKLKLIFKIFGVQDGKIYAEPVFEHKPPASWYGNRIAVVIGIQRKDVLSRSTKQS